MLAWLFNVLDINKHKFVQKDAKVEVLDIIMSLIVQSCAELGEKSWLPLTTLDSL